jgi:hypothetical protein
MGINIYMEDVVKDSVKNLNAKPLNVECFGPNVVNALKIVVNIVVESLQLHVKIIHYNKNLLKVIL